MFRPMRRSGQQLPREEAEAILSRCTSGVLALLGDGQNSLVLIYRMVRDTESMGI